VISSSFQQILEHFHDTIRQRPRLDVLIGGGFHHLDAVLVGAGEEERFIPMSR